MSRSTCFCDKCGVNGKLVSDRTRKRHLTETDTVRQGLVLCTCRICGTEGRNISTRLARKHRESDDLELYTQTGDIYFPSVVNFLKNSLEERNSPLFAGSTWSVLGFHASMHKLKCGHPGLSQSAFTDILCLFKRVLEESGLENVKIKDTYKSSFSCIEELLVPSKTVDICINDCVSFTGEYADLDSCPVCKESRYVFSKPVKQYEYIELLPRIAQFYELPKISKLLQVPAKDGKLMTDFKDSPRWKEIFEGDGHFKRDERHLVLSCMQDGGDPWKKQACTSLWPTVLGIYNFPPELRDKADFLLTYGITQGTKSPQSLDAYNMILISELRQLENGVRIFDGFRQEFFTLTGVLDKLIFDFPGGCKSCHRSYTGAERPCLRCQVSGVRSKSAGTRVFFENRRYLPKDHPLRKDNAFPGNTTEFRAPPEPKETKRGSDSEVLRNASQVEDARKQLSEAKSKLEKRQSKQNLEHIIRQTGKTGKEAWWGLEHYDQKVQTIDVMHTSGNVIKTFFKVLTGFNQVKRLKRQLTETASELKVKSKTGHIRKGLKCLKKTRDLRPYVKRRNCPAEKTKCKMVKKTDPKDAIKNYQTAIQIPRKGLKLANELLKNIQMPSYFPRPIDVFTKGIFSTTNQCIKFCTEGVLNYAIQKGGFLNPDTRAVVRDLSTVLAKMNLPVISDKIVSTLEMETWEVLSRKEKLFPHHANTLMFHLLGHLPD